MAAQAMRSCHVCRVGGLAILVTLALLGCGTAHRARYVLDDPAPPARCFTSAGHTVSGNFLRYFESMGGVESLGYPITEPFRQDGRQVQYFEYARLEDHPDNPGQPLVKLSMLGERRGRRQPPVSLARVPPSSDRNSRYYPQMGHAVSGDFLIYFDEHGGLSRFGFPIAEPLVFEGKLVQDFQRARFEWHLSRTPEDRVTLEPSGHLYFRAQGLDPKLLDPIPCPHGSDVVQLNASRRYRSPW